MDTGLVCSYIWTCGLDMKLSPLFPCLQTGPKSAATSYVSLRHTMISSPTWLSGGMFREGLLGVSSLSLSVSGAAGLILLGVDPAECWRLGSGTRRLFRCRSFFDGLAATEL